MKVLVTGANGYIGRHVVEKLLEKENVEVIANDVNVEGVDKRAISNKTNLFTSQDPYNEFEQPEVCIHLAWMDGFVHNADSHILYLSNHYSFIKKMLDGGLKHLVVMGTMHEVGYYEGAIDENTPCNPLSKYGIAKNTLRQSLELLVKNYEGVVFQWLRGFYIVGDSERGNSIFSKITRAEKNGEKTFPFTTGKNKYDFVDLDLFAKQIVESSLQSDVVGVINCCSGEPVSLAERVEKFIKDNEYSIKLNYGAFPDRAYDSPAIWGDNSKINRIIRNSK